MLNVDSINPSYLFYRDAAEQKHLYGFKKIVLEKRGVYSLTGKKYHYAIWPGSLMIRKAVRPMKITFNTYTDNRWQYGHEPCGLSLIPMLVKNRWREGSCLCYDHHLFDREDSPPNTYVVLAHTHVEDITFYDGFNLTSSRINILTDWYLVPERLFYSFSRETCSLLNEFFNSPQLKHLKQHTD